MNRKVHVVCNFNGLYETEELVKGIGSQSLR